MVQKTHNQARGNIIADNDGYGPYALGGQVNMKSGSVAYTNTTAKTLFTLPAGAIPVAIVVNVSTAFDASTTNLLDIGLGSDGDGLADGWGVDTAGQLTTGPAPGLFAALAEETDVTATFAGTGDAAEAGAATVAVFYILM
jgi:hypothetical protein